MTDDAEFRRLCAEAEAASPPPIYTAADMPAVIARAQRIRDLAAIIAQVPADIFTPLAIAAHLDRAGYRLAALDAEIERAERDVCGDAMGYARLAGLRRAREIIAGKDKP